MNKEEVKRRISIEQIFADYGSTQDGKGYWRCLRPQNHTNGDRHHSVKLNNGRAYCFSQKCFEDKGVDIFALVGLMENLSPFPEQKAWIEKEYGLTDGKPGTERRIVAAYDYTDASGKLIFQTVRYEPKDFKQRQPDGKGGWIWKVKGIQPVLYRLPDVLGADRVLIVEGERDANSAYQLGLPPGYAATTSSMGAEKWRPEYAAFLKGKTVVICPDQDEPGRRHGKQIAESLTGVAREVFWLDLPEGKDLSEWMHTGTASTRDVAELLERAAPIQWETEQEAHTEDQRGGKKSQATNLVQLAERCELFDDGGQKGYATMFIRDHAETWPLRRKSIKNWLAREFYLRHRVSPSSQAVNDALGVIEGMAIYESDQKDVYTRVGGNATEMYLDLGRDDWKMAKITAQGWEIVLHGAVKFRRGSGMKPLPEPGQGGNLRKLLEPFIIFDEEDKWTLLIGFMVSTIRHIGAQFILEFQGEQGSGKSTIVDLVKSVIDPNAGGRRTQPRDERDLMICASNNWLVSLDNLSGVPPWLSDGLCRLSTGGVLATRTLYSDNDETLFEAKRPSLVNGIGGVVTRPDLLDRSITIPLPTIPEDKRRSEREFWNDYRQVSGKILGALLDAAAGAMQHIGSMNLPKVERMADDVLWVTAAERVLGWEKGTFQKAYRANRATGNETALESSLIYEPLQKLMAERAVWEGMPMELLKALNGFTDENKPKPKGWPGTPRGMRSALERIAPNLRAAGMRVEFPTKRTDRGSQICISQDSDRKQPTEPTGLTAEPANPGSPGSSGSRLHTYSCAKEVYDLDSRSVGPI